MSIAEELSRIKNAKQAIKEAINSKAGNTVIDESQLISDYATAINNLALSGNSEFGYIDEQGNFQPLDLSGDTPADIGEAKAVSLKMFNTGVEAPQAPSASSMDFYRCAAVYGPRDVDVFVISGCPVEAANGTYMPTEYTTEDWEGTPYPVYSNGTYYYYYEPNNWMKWGISQDYTSSSLLYSGSGTSWQDSDWNPVEGMSSVESKVTVDLDVPKTWDGYKAVESNGVYTFESTPTTGLTYGTAYKPTIGKLYLSDCSVCLQNVKMAIPSGAKVYAPFNQVSDTAETGQAITFVNPVTPRISIVDGVPCADFANRSYANIAASDLNLDNDFTVSVWARFNVSPSSTGEPFPWQIGGNSKTGVSVAMHTTRLQMSSTNITSWNGSLDNYRKTQYWYHIVVIKQGDTFTIYLNGELLGSIGHTLSLANYNVIGINRHRFDDDSYRANASCIAAFRFYERALNESEIYALANEFAPKIASVAH